MKEAVEKSKDNEVESLKKQLQEALKRAEATAKGKDADAEKEAKEIVQMQGQIEAEVVVEGELAKHKEARWGPWSTRSLPGTAPPMKRRNFSRT